MITMAMTMATADADMIILYGTLHTSTHIVYYTLLKHTSSEPFRNDGDALQWEYTLCAFAETNPLMYTALHIRL